MKKITISAILVVLAFIGFTQTIENYISGDTPILISIKNKVINEKIDEGQLNTLEVYQNLSKETKDFFTTYLKSVILNDKSTGVSLESNSYISVNLNDTINAFQFILPMLDKSKFESTIQNYRYYNRVLTENSELIIYKKDFGNDIIAYNNDVIILTNIDVKYDYLEQKSKEHFGYISTPYYPYGDVIIEEVIEEEPIPAYEEELPIATETEIYEETPKRDYQAERNFKDSVENIIQLNYLTNFSTQKTSLSKDLQAFLNKSYDIGFYMDYEAFIKLYTDNSFGNSITRNLNYLKMMQALYSMYANSKLYGELSFEEDKIVVKSAFKTDKETASAMSNILDAKVNKKMLKYIKSDSTVSVVSMAFNVEAYVDFYKTTIEKLIESYSDKTSEVEMMKDAFDIATTLFLDEDEIYDLFKGDILFTFNGVQSYTYQSKYSEYETRATKPVFSLMSSMGNKNVMDKVLNIIRKSDLFIEKGNYFISKKTIDREIGNLYIAYFDGIFFFSNNADLMRNLGSGYPKSEQLSKTQQKKILSNSTYAFFDADKLVTSFSDVISEREKPTFKVFSETMGLMELTGTQIEGDTLTSKLVVDVEGEENSLMNILLMIHKMYESTKR